MLRRETDQNPQKGVEMTQHDDRRDARGGLSRLRRPRLLPYAAALVVASIAVASGSAARGPALAAPSSLQTFMKRIGEPRKLSGNGIPEYSRTPSFAWAAVRGASHYEFELSTSGDFRSGNGLVWQSKTLTTPATSIPLALPWTSDVEWRVRAMRRVYGAAKNALPAVSYGPWSPVYDWKNSYDALGTSATVAPVASVSDALSYKGRAQVHSLTPGLLFAGNGD